MAKNQRLPKGFRYLFTTKEVKAIAAAAGTSFRSIRTGNISTAEHLQVNSFFQGSFRGPSIDAHRISDEWQFSIHQTGFRAELLPTEFESVVKTEIQTKFTAFLHRVLTSGETDFLRGPGIWAHVMLMNGKATVSYTEHK